MHQTLSVEEGAKRMDQLTPEERKQLRLARFGGLNGKSKQHMPAMNEAATTLEAL